ncbi:MAG: GNAT family N-acetyltransferase [Oscillospiraceae bacterium]|nr:GNAT family N-acetyltransferase [Oscillospiraceae bacterium]
MCNIRLETKRLFVRSYEEKDLPEYHRLMSDKENMYYMDDLITNNLEESRESLNHCIAFNKSGNGLRFVVALKENDKLMGGIEYDIIRETPIGKISGIGWFIMPEYQNKGYITEAAKKVLEFAFMRDNCIRIETGCYKDNIPTQKVMEKVGFRKEAEKIKSQWHDGKMKDRLGFALNKDEYMRIFDDDNYCDFWINGLLPVYKFLGEYEFLRDDECADASALSKICEGQSRGVNGESEEWFKKWLNCEETGQKDVGATDSAVLVHKIDGKIAGFCCTCIYGHGSEKGAVVWIRWIEVSPEFQGRGIGRNLLMQTLQYGAEHGAKRAFLAVDLENKNAVKLYESIGFVQD